MSKSKRKPGRMRDVSDCVFFREKRIRKEGERRRRKHEADITKMAKNIRADNK